YGAGEWIGGHSPASARRRSDPALGEKGLQEGAAFRLTDAGRDLAAMVEGGELQQIEDASGRARFGITGAENHPRQPYMDDRSRAHGARLLGYVKRAVGQPPIAEGLLGLRQRQHLGMRGGVLEQFYLVECARDDAPFADD